MKNGPYKATDDVIIIAKGVWGMKHLFVNFYMVQQTHGDKWFLVDAGLKWSASKIKKMAATLFGEESKPACIVLTHGHFDHVGSVAELARFWDVPVYAHVKELPFLTGKAHYPPADPTVGGGLMASMSFTYPLGPIDIRDYATVLPEEGAVPGFDEWQYIHTPGHSPGHISLFRSTDRVLIAGDAFVTTKAESALSILMQTKKICRPPAYLTTNWFAAKESVGILADLEPSAAATGHGMPMYGKELLTQLRQLNENFVDEAVPVNGRYVNEPAISDTNGLVYVPPAIKDNHLIIKVAAFTAALVAAFFISKNKRQKRLRRNQYLLDFEYNF